MCSRICKHNYRITIIVKIGYHDHSPAGLVVTGVPLARDDMHSPRATGRPLSIHPGFVKSRYKRTDSVTAMLDELGWPILSKRRKDARLILFYKIINNLAQVPHEHILTKAYEGTRKKNNHKFRHIHIAVNTSQYSLYRQSFFPKTVGPWNQLSFADSPTLENFRTNLLSTNRP